VTRHTPIAHEGGHQVLLTRLDRGLASRVRTAVTAADLDVIEVPWGPATTDLVRATPVGVVIVGYPILASSFSSFVRALRAMDSASRTAGLILTAHAEDVRTAEGFVGRGVNRVLRYDALAEALIPLIRELLSVAPRTPISLPAVVTIPAPDGGRPLNYRTENISASGMLLRGSAQLPVGTVLQLQVELPDDERPLRSTAEVTRTTDPAIESVQGIGIRFTGFPEAERRRLAAFLNSGRAT
jgi:uncharacterized protein (TIGR02266 family)